eukprot:2519020-Prymnesium_polylepis.1
MQGTPIVWNTTTESPFRLYDVCSMTCTIANPSLGPCLCGLPGICEDGPSPNFRLFEPGAVCPPGTAPRDTDECRRAFQELKLPSYFHAPSYSMAWFPTGCNYLDSSLTSWSAFAGMLFDGGYFNSHPAGSITTYARAICRAPNVTTEMTPNVTTEVTPNVTTTEVTPRANTPRYPAPPSHASHAPLQSPRSPHVSSSAGEARSPSAPLQPPPKAPPHSPQGTSNLPLLLLT